MLFRFAALSMKYSQLEHGSWTSAPTTNSTLSNAIPSDATTAVFGWSALMSSCRLASASLTPRSSGVPEPSSRDRPKKSAPSCAVTPLTRGATGRSPAAEARPGSIVRTPSLPEVKSHMKLLWSWTTTATLGVAAHETTPDSVVISVLSDA